MPQTLRILVVESEEALSRQIAEALSAVGYQVDLARSGREALNRAERSRYERVILDLCLPDITGILVYLMLRGIDPSLPQRTLLVSTAPAQFPGHDLGALGLGYLPRPFAVQDLIDRLAVR
jgi:DNA-binding response OmpR family regulator